MTSKIVENIVKI